MCFSPFARRSLYEMFRISTDIIDHGATSPDILVLPADCRPVLQFGIVSTDTLTDVLMAHRNYNRAFDVCMMNDDLMGTKENIECDYIP